MNQAKANKSFQKKMLNPFFFKLFLFLKLPMAFLAGLKLKELTDEHAVVLMKYKYLNKNPFGSIYFACLSMAGELASGLLAASIACMGNTKFSMLLILLKRQLVQFCLNVIRVKKFYQLFKKV